MRLDTFRQWLESQGCHFDQNSHDRGQGHVGGTVKLAGKKSILPLAGSHQDMDEADICRVVKELGLDMAELPGSQDTETEKYRHDTTSRG